MAHPFKPGDVICCRAGDNPRYHWVGIIRETTRRFEEAGDNWKTTAPLTFCYPDRDNPNWMEDGWVDDLDDAEAQGITLHPDPDSIKLEYMKWLTRSK